MRIRLIVGVTALAVLTGGVVLGVQSRDTACERYVAAEERGDDYDSFEEQQGTLAKTLAECMAEEAGRNRG